MVGVDAQKPEQGVGFRVLLMPGDMLRSDYIVRCWYRLSSPLTGQQTRSSGKKRMPAKACCHITVRYYECDPLGHVNHAVHLHYFEVGRLDAMSKAALPFSAVLKQGYTVVATDVFVQYKAPAFTDDVLEVQSCITRFRGARMIWQQELFRCSSGELLALAEVTGAFTLADGRPVRIPPIVQALLEAVYVPEAAWSSPRQRRSPAS